MIDAVLVGAAAGLASIPHCAAMCGAIASAACTGSRSSLAYQAARLAAYAGLGAAVGAAGSAVTRLLPQGAATIILGVGFGLGLFVLAARLLGTPRDPSLVTLRNERVGAAERAQNLLVAAGLGFGTGLLPCGALYATLLLGASAGSAPRGAAVLASFALASAPGLFFAQTLSGWLRKQGAVEGRRIVGAVLVLGGILVVLRAISSVVTAAPACHVS